LIKNSKKKESNCEILLQFKNNSFLFYIINFNDGKAELSHDPLGIIQISWFVAQKTILSMVKMATLFLWKQRCYFLFVF